MSTTIKIPFATQEMGYDRNQVDKYVQKLADEYRGLQHRYNELSEKKNGTPLPANGKRETIGSIGAASGSIGPVNAEAISKAIVDAEVKAIQIVAEAKNEASRVIGNAYTELGKIQQERDRVILEINALVKKLKETIPTVEERLL